MNAVGRAAGYRYTLALLCALAWMACARVAAAADFVAEPEGYRMDEYRTPTPATLRGATVVNARQLHVLLEREPALIDVLPLMRKPPDFPPGNLWRTPPRRNIPGSAWLPNVGDGDISPVFEEYLNENLERLTARNKQRPLVFYCLIDCWMSWNSAKRAIALGYRNVYWFPGGTDEWELMGYPLELSDPVKMPEFREIPRAPQTAAADGVRAAVADTAPKAAPGADDEYTKEQRLLFDTPHLENVASESVLHYDFRQAGSHAREIEDQVTLEITRVAEDGAKNLSVEFLSGVNKRPFADITNFHSNPAIMYFLQWDVEKMSGGRRVTHHHFRHLLRQAFRTGTHSEEVTVTRGGRKLKARKVFMRPLAGRGDDKRYQGYTGKLYEFILSASIPGYIYSISTLIVGEETDAEPLESVRMVFNRLEPAEPKE